MTNTLPPRLKDSHANILAIEMEAIGITRVVADSRETQENRPELLVVRGISDYGEASREKTWASYAAEAAATFALSVLQHLPPR